MKGFLTGAALGAAIGYTQGTKAGQVRYEQIRQSTQRLTSTPAAQRLAGSINAAKNRGTNQAEGVLTSVMNRAAGVSAKGEKV